MPEFYSPRQVGEIFHVTPDTVRRWIQEGKLKASRPGGEKSSLRISQNEVTRLAEERYL